ncbi:MAG: class I SAM-dependent methyltransferase [Anaerolineae bacterium]|nr:class I SAM-dependent methyltransferase [Anaerolineae bacterium]
MSRRVRPVGQPTRGKTALNRLRQIDVYVALALPGVLMGDAPLIVDVGFGAYAWTTLEMRERWLTINPHLRVIGIEIDPARVAAALAYADPPTVGFRLGGFNLPDALVRERARLIRCYNVLRQYDESAVVPALEAMAVSLEPGGILIEGTSNPSGRIVAFDVYQKQGDGLIHRALIFGTNFRAPIEPVDFQAILPKRLIHHMLDLVPAAFFAAWQDSFAVARGQGWRGRQQWIVAAKLLKTKYNYPVDTRAGLLRRGYVALRDALQ